MTLYSDILWLGWPLFVGAGIAVVAALRLSQALTGAGGATPPVVSRALTFFEEGDPLRALVLLEGEAHPLGVVLSGFWKSVSNPRQWEGTALIAEYQRRRPALLAAFQRRQTVFAQTLWITLFFQLGWLAGQRPDLFRQPLQEFLLTGPAAGILWVLFAGGVWGLSTLSRQTRRLKALAVQADQVVYQSITALAQGKGLSGSSTPRTIPPAPTNNASTPPNIVAKTYKG